MTDFKTLSQLLWGRYPIRECSGRARHVELCALCSEEIQRGQFFYDGGCSRRGHKGCVEDRKLHWQGRGLDHLRSILAETTAPEEPR